MTKEWVATLVRKFCPAPRRRRRNYQHRLYKDGISSRVETVFSSLWICRIRNFTREFRSKKDFLYRYLFLIDRRQFSQHDIFNSKPVLHSWWNWIFHLSGGWGNLTDSDLGDNLVCLHSTQWVLIRLSLRSIDLRSSSVTVLGKLYSTIDRETLSNMDSTNRFSHQVSLGGIVQIN